jgi:hypothetical protein
LNTASEPARPLLSVEDLSLLYRDLLRRPGVPDTIVANLPGALTDDQAKDLLDIFSRLTPPPDSKLAAAFDAYCRATLHRIPALGDAVHAYEKEARTTDA